MRAIYVDDSRIIVEILKSGVVFDSEKGLFIYSDNMEDYIETDIEENMKRTEVEIDKAMNFISSDLKFTTETERDFRKKRLPTLSFETWSTKNGIRHSYFEKDMRSQILTQKMSSQSEQSKFNILVNELHRRFEVLDSKVEITEKIEIIDHFVLQLVNSDYSFDQIKNIVESGLKGIIRKEQRKKERANRYRKGEETLVERERKKLLENTSWYRDKINSLEEAMEREHVGFKSKDGAWKNYRKKEKWSKIK